MVGRILKMNSRDVVLRIRITLIAVRVADEHILAAKMKDEKEIFRLPIHDLREVTRAV